MNNENLQIEKNQNDITKNMENPSEQNGWNDIGKQKTKHNEKYQESEKSIIKELAKKDKTAYEIACVLNRSIRSILYISSKLKIRIRRDEELKKIEIDEIIRLHSLRTPTKEIASIINKSESTVCKTIRLLLAQNVIHPIRKVTENEEVLIKKLIDEGKNLYEIANILNRSVSKVSKLCKKIGKFTAISLMIKEQLDLQSNGLKKCRGCNTIKVINPQNFYTEKYQRCIDCCKKESRERFRSKRGVKLSLENFLKYKLKNSLITSKSPKFNYEFNLTYDYLLKIYHNQNGRCFYTNRLMTFICGCNNSLSIDRINSDLGYTIDNIVLCCSKVNAMKLDLSYIDFVKTCGEISNLHITNEK